MRNKNGLFAIKLILGCDITVHFNRITTAVAAAASVPSSLTSI